MKPDQAIASTIVGMLVLTPVVIFVSYADWEFWTFNAFWNWPYVRASLILTIITTQSAILHAHTGTSDFGAGLAYGLGIFPILFYLVYPGLDQLGLRSDSDMPTALLLLSTVHGIGFGLIARARVHMQNESDKDKQRLSSTETSTQGARNRLRPLLRWRTK